MKFHKQKIPGVWIIEAEPFTDHRGRFRRHYCQKEYEKHGLETNIVQTNISENKMKHTLRGFHFQKKPYGECKTFSCLQGSVYDIVVDLRPGSETFLKWISLKLKGEDFLSLHIPHGCANAFLTQEDSTTMLYYASEYYRPEFESGVRYNDPTFNFEWPVEPSVISEKDKSFPNLDPHSADL
jgi:dTDP-4-dehydrorhamnose 3,5-epimerase